VRARRNGIRVDALPQLGEQPLLELQILRERACASGAELLLELHAMPGLELGQPRAHLDREDDHDQRARPENEQDRIRQPPAENRRSAHLH